MSEGFDESKEKIFDVYASDFVQTSKVGLSMASNIIKSDKIMFYHGKTDTGSDKLLEGEFTMKEKMETLTIRVNENIFDSSTYSGKIFFESKDGDILISIPVEIKIQRNPAELLSFAGIGILVGIILVWRITKGDGQNKNITGLGKWVHERSNKNWKVSDEKPMIVTGLITAVSIPSLLIVSNELVGSYAIDTSLACSIGVLVLLKLLKEDKTQESPAAEDND